MGAPGSRGGRRVATKARMDAAAPNATAEVTGPNTIEMNAAP